MSVSKTQSSIGKRWLSIVAISLVFFGAYFVLRALPDAQCGFLHYDEIVNANGEVELCATNHAGFLDLSRLKYPVQATLETAEPLRPGEMADVSLTLKTRGGMTIAPHELAVTHTKKMHVMLIDPSLEDYHHLHPQPDGIDGRYLFDFEPKRPGNYQVFTEIVPARSRRQAIAVSELEVPGEPGELRFDRSVKSVVGGLHFELESIPETLRTGRDYRFELYVNDASGAPAPLEMVMGAKGHMVAFDAARKGFAHMHPIDTIASARTAGLSLGDDRGESLDFMFNVPNPGWYRLFAQIQIDGEAVFGRFDLKVEE
ncbi:MAG: hypothetical protein GVY36_13930 [Verrucomicrobia bacterium]|jgi:hypothetical protein|nr:hypothetical protein [Verrucomicrobiota bacterium]